MLGDGGATVGQEFAKWKMECTHNNYNHNKLTKERMRMRVRVRVSERSTVMLR